MTYDEKRCAIDGCERRHKGRGYCDMHLQRLRRTGTTADPRRLTLAERFWPKVDRRGPTDCWPWTAATNENGYGVMRPDTDRSDGPTIKAHRVSLMLAGIDPAGFVVLHSCDNPPCVNPAHLSVGTQHDNAMDRERKGRGNQPRKVPREAWDEIRRRAAAGEVHRMIAADYDVSRSTITRIVSAVADSLGAAA